MYMYLNIGHYITYNSKIYSTNRERKKRKRKNHYQTIDK